ncbi:MAG: DegT/DnrJ/EryC1/StrS family aminotransferase [Nanoarchaeota archaeon]|nr:DegT/DnrJ/EryC1/StrS family aminotransferase [Nanoarchaeota archaeon]
MKVKQSCPTFDMEEYSEIKECFSENWLTEGLKTKEFEEKIRDMVGVKYGLVAPNGTLALYLCLKSLGIKEGDEVIVPNHTFFASASSVLMVNALPIFVDIEQNNVQIDLEKCERALTSKTKAIMPVHLYGFACNMDKVCEFAKKHNLKIIEDACQALNISWKGKKCGSFGDVNAFSFFADKALSTVEGGFMATNDKEISNKLQYLKNQGRLNRGSFVHEEIGFNFRLNDLQSSIGLTQLRKFDGMTKRRLEIYEMYKEQLKNVSQVKVVEPPAGSSHIPFRTILMCKEESQDLMSYMTLNEIEPRSLFFPLHNQPAFKHLKDQVGYKDEDFPNSIYAYNHGICLPCYPNLTNEQVKFVCDTIKEYYNV